VVYDIRIFVVIKGSRINGAILVSVHGGPGDPNPVRGHQGAVNVYLPNAVKN
jgi:hypothetical protein